MDTDDTCGHGDRERYTCGTCRLEWCGLCQPTPAARCPKEAEHPDTDPADEHKSTTSYGEVFVHMIERLDGKSVLIQIDTTDDMPENERGPAGLVVCLNDGDLYRNTDDGQGGNASLIDVQYDERFGNWTVYARSDSSQDWTRVEGDGDELSSLLSIAHDIVTGG